MAVISLTFFNILLAALFISLGALEFLLPVFFPGKKDFFMKIYLLVMIAGSFLAAVLIGKNIYFLFH